MAAKKEKEDKHEDARKRRAAALAAIAELQKTVDDTEKIVNAVEEDTSMVEDDNTHSDGQLLQTTDTDVTMQSAPSTPPASEHDDTSMVVDLGNGDDFEPEPDDVAEGAISEDEQPKSKKKKPSKKERVLELRKTVNDASGGKFEGVEEKKRARAESVVAKDAPKPKKGKNGSTGGLRTDWREVAAKAAAGAQKIKPTTKVPEPTNKVQQGDMEITLAAGFVGDEDKRAVGPSSNVKMGVKIEFGKPAETIDAPSKQLKAPRQTVRNSDLHLNKDDQNTWTRVLVPTVLAYVGSNRTPWDTGSDNKFLEDFKLIFKGIFPDLSEHDITCTSSEHRLINQRLYEWRSDLGDVAGKAVEMFWGKQSKHEAYTTAEAKSDYVKINVVSSPNFVYESLQAAAKGVKIFRAKPVLYVLGSHLRRVVKSRFQYGHPQGALALICAALERSFLMWNSGEKGTIEKQTFNHVNWGKTTTEYLELVDQLNDNHWSKICDAARAHYADVSSKAVIELDSEPVGTSHRIPRMKRNNSRILVVHLEYKQKLLLNSGQIHGAILFTLRVLRTNPQRIKEYYQWSQHKYGPMLYAGSIPQSRQVDAKWKPTGFMESDLMIRLLAPILRLARASASDYGDPIGAFALGATALERAFKLYRSGFKADYKNNKKLDFSEENYSGKVLEYVKSVSQISEAGWQRIRAACAVVNKDESNSSNDDDDEGEDSEDALDRSRANLYVPSSPAAPR
ncbi:hypothetical protein CPB83DRAFT_887471 [Crepidotus variabilis]|uniref:Uncharacterized protein n=1 Tax=Crepidotus variabilis TaxID=179855 RepID=A0A9P6E4W1_9AGAR|nr:hypothetical protein CPB83DRAFT_887471 [Crepidotus variabilis]